MKKLLIISNNVMSETSNNGKTIFSFVEGLKKEDVSQIYFSGEMPQIEGYSYYRITDKDIIKGLLIKGNRGRQVKTNVIVNAENDLKMKKLVGRNTITLMVRDCLWYKKWNSPQLVKWLDDIRPDAVFFVAGDTLFAYDICEYVKNRYGSRLTVFVTDDYIIERKNDSFFEKKRRNKIKKKLDAILKQSECFYTISQPMREIYNKIFKKNSFVAVNMADDYLDRKIELKNKEIILIYTGSLYYGRDEVLAKLAYAIKEYNNTHEKKARLIIYSNRAPSNAVKKTICIPNSSEYGGSLDNKQVKRRLNSADVLVFVESYNFEQIEKVKYSLSTKVPEYMSVGKPILALGPQGIASMEYLSDVAICVNSLDMIYSKISRLFNNIDLQNEYGQKARRKYLKNHNRKKNQKEFVRNIFGMSED